MDSSSVGVASRYNAAPAPTAVGASRSEHCAFILASDSERVKGTVINDFSQRITASALTCALSVERVRT
jgi:hypothetical protein